MNSVGNVLGNLDNHGALPGSDRRTAGSRARTENQADTILLERGRRVQNLDTEEVSCVCSLHLPTKERRKRKAFGHTLTITSPTKNTA